MSRVVPKAVNEVRLVINRHRFRLARWRAKPKIAGDIRELFLRFPNSDPLNYNCLTAVRSTDNAACAEIILAIERLGTLPSERIPFFSPFFPLFLSFFWFFFSVNWKEKTVWKRHGRGSTTANNSSRTVILELISETVEIFKGPLARDKGTRGTAFSETFSWLLISRPEFYEIIPLGYAVPPFSKRRTRGCVAHFMVTVPFSRWSLWFFPPANTRGRRLNNDQATPRSISMNLKRNRLKFVNSPPSLNAG